MIHFQAIKEKTYFTEKPEMTQSQEDGNDYIDGRTGNDIIQEEMEMTLFMMETVMISSQTVVLIL